MVKVIKLLVHVLLSSALSSWLMRALQLGDGVTLLNISYVTSLSLNWLMDYLGHRGGSRTPLTHEPFNASILSVGVAVAVGFLFLYNPAYMLATIVSSGVCYTTHLLLDLLSGGIYIREGDNYRRVRLARQSRSVYDQLNALVLSISLLLTAFFLISSPP